MSRREPPAPRLAEPAPPKPGRAAAAPAVHAPAAASAMCARIEWEKIFQAASPAQREELLSLARSQGLLYSFQVPSVNAAVVENGADRLIELLAGHHERLTPIQHEAMEVSDTQLDA